MSVLDSPALRGVVLGGSLEPAVLAEGAIPFEALVSALELAANQLDALARSSLAPALQPIAARAAGSIGKCLPLARRVEAVAALAPNDPQVLDLVGAISAAVKACTRTTRARAPEPAHEPEAAPRTRGGVHARRRSRRAKCSLSPAGGARADTRRRVGCST